MISDVISENREVYAAKLLKSVLGGIWLTLLLCASFKVSVYSFQGLRAEPWNIIIPVLATVPIPFILALWFGQHWGWVSSVALALLSLFAVAFVAWLALTMPLANAWQGRMWLEFLWIIPALTVVAVLFYNRRWFFPHVG